MPETFKPTCGNCAHGQPSPDRDFAKRLCFGGPPQIIVIQQQPQFIKGVDGKPQQISQGGIAMQNARPIVPASDPGCALHQPRMQIAEQDGQDVVTKQ